MELTGYAMVYGDKTLPLTGSIPAKGAYLIVDAAEISKQKSLKRVEHGESFQIIVWEKGEATVDEEYVLKYAPRNSKGEYGSVHSTAAVEPSFTPVVTGSERVKGYYDATAALGLELAGRYNSGAMNADGGRLEIVQYNPVNGFAYAVSGV